MWDRVSGRGGRLARGVSMVSTIHATRVRMRTRIRPDLKADLTCDLA
jgi:hypothetical protein